MKESILGGGGGCLLDVDAFLTRHGPTGAQTGWVFHFTTVAASARTVFLREQLISSAQVVLCKNSRPLWVQSETIKLSALGRIHIISV